MPVEVMKVSSKSKHPNADTLFVYEMLDKNNQQFTIVANSENIYELDDHVMIVKVGSVLKENNLYIDESNIRGIISAGMAIGLTEEPVGTDFTIEHCASVYHMSWPDIVALYNVRDNLKKTDSVRKITYGAKVKLDGTCGAIQIQPSGDIVFQSRSRIITPDNDEKNFARWGVSNKSYFSQLAKEEMFILYGEWCGIGIAKRCSISKIDRKVFCVFAIQYGNEFEINPYSIQEVLPKHNDVFVIPFFDVLEMDYSNDEELQKSVDIANGWIAEIEECDPFVKETFGVEGLGEGLVFYPLPEKANRSAKDSIRVNRAEYAQLVFKSKGEKHKVVKTKEAVQIDPEVAKSIDEFVELFVTENRLEQISQKIGEPDIKQTGAFLKAFNEDVIKESELELKASNLTWKEVSGAVSFKAKNWWISKTQKI